LNLGKINSGQPIFTTISRHITQHSLHNIFQPPEKWRVPFGNLCAFFDEMLLIPHKVQVSIFA